MIHIDELAEGKIPPWIRRFIKQTGRGINRYSMIGEGDSVVIGISGGKDSLALALALSIRKKWLPIDYKLYAVMIDWIEDPVDEEGKQKLKKFFSILEIPFLIKGAHKFPDSFKGEFNCYLCSRNRRRILFEYAEEVGSSRIVLGHHLDDIVETSLINLCFRGEFSTMKPVQDFFGGRISIMRPMCEVRESIINRLNRETDLPTVKTECPYSKMNIRSKMKPIIRELSHIDKLTREHIYAAHEF